MLGHRLLLQQEASWLTALSSTRGAEGTFTKSVASFTVDGSNEVCVTLELSSIWPPEPLLEERCLDLSEAVVGGTEPGDPVPVDHPEDACTPVPEAPDTPTDDEPAGCEAGAGAPHPAVVLLILLAVWLRPRGTEPA